MIAIIDYDAGNLRSVENALQFIGEKSIITRDRKEILSADRVILPGVGSFGDAMEKLHRFELIDTIKEVADYKIPLLGICLGLQLLFQRSDESPGVEGLCVLEGNIAAIPPKEGFKIPHMGWNSLQIKKGAALFRVIKEIEGSKRCISQEMPYVYFVHSYYLKARNETDIAAETEYITDIHASVEHENIFACQFHPEKSGETGLKILRNFCNIS